MSDKMFVQCVLANVQISGFHAQLSFAFAVGFLPAARLLTVVKRMQAFPDEQSGSKEPVFQESLVLRKLKAQHVKEDTAQVVSYAQILKLRVTMPAFLTMVRRASIR